MSHSPEQVLQELTNGKYHPIYFLQGDEPYYIDQISDYIEENALNEADKGFNQTILYGKDVNMAQVLGNARRFPMMAEKQVVIVKEAKDIQDLGKEDGQKLLINYLENPVPSTILVFAHKHKNIDGRKPVAKALKKDTVFVSTEKIRDYKLPEWIDGYVKKRGYQINDRTSYLLAEYIGTNLERLTNEISKVLINLPEGGTVDEDLVQKYIGVSKEYNVFELQRALSQRDVVKANKIVNYFASNLKANPVIPVVALLFSYFNKLLLFHGTKDKSDNNLASVMGLRPFLIKEYKMAASNYHLAKVMMNIRFLKEADLKLKGVDAGGADEGQILRELVFKLLH